MSRSRLCFVAPGGSPGRRRAEGGGRRQGEGSPSGDRDGGQRIAWRSEGRGGEGRASKDPRQDPQSYHTAICSLGQRVRASGTTPQEALQHPDPPRTLPGPFPCRFRADQILAPRPSPARHAYRTPLFPSSSQGSAPSSALIGRFHATSIRDRPDALREFVGASVVCCVCWRKVGCFVTDFTKRMNTPSFPTLFN